MWPTGIERVWCGVQKALLHVVLYERRHSDDVYLCHQRFVLWGPKDLWKSSGRVLKTTEKRMWLKIWPHADGVEHLAWLSAGSYYPASLQRFSLPLFKLPVPFHLAICERQPCILTPKSKLHVKMMKDIFHKYSTLPFASLCEVPWNTIGYLDMNDADELPLIHGLLAWKVCWDIVRMYSRTEQLSDPA